MSFTAINLIFKEHQVEENNFIFLYKVGAMIDLYKTIKLHPEYFKQLKVKDLLFTQYNCPQENALEQLFSMHNYIAYVISGKRTFYLPGEVHTMTEGKCIFAKKGAWIAEKEPGMGWCVLVFFIPDEYLKQFVVEHRSSLNLPKRKSEFDFKMLELEVNDSTKGFFQSMIPYFNQTPAIPESLLELKFKELLLNLVINPRNDSLLSWFYNVADNTKQSLASIMEANYTYHLSLEEYARITNRSLATFKRDFKQQYNTTPGKWLIQKRLNHAALLLTTSTKLINEITFNSGFENTTHFSRLFKEKFGMSPSDYRHTSGIKSTLTFRAILLNVREI